MKRVYKINTEEKGKILLADRYEFIIFARDMQEALKKVSKCIDKKQEIKEAELLCIVEEDKDLEKYK